MFVEEVFECRCCEELINENDMLKIPDKPKVLANWVNILGPTFQKNIKHDEKNMVCLRHFQESEWEARSTRNIRAKKVNVVEPSVPKYKHYLTTCRYCGKKCDQRTMSSVPRKSELLKKWFDILGPEFKKSCGKFRRSFICMSHFNIPYGMKTRKPHILPIRMDSADEMPNLEEEQRISSNGDDNDSENDEIPNLRTYGTLEKELLQCDVQRGNALIVRNTKRKCTFCEKSKNEKEMTRVPRKADLFAKWSNILGEKFRKNVETRSNFSSFICLSHFDLRNNRKIRKSNDFPVNKEFEMNEGEKIRNILLRANEEMDRLQGVTPSKSVDYPDKTKSINLKITLKPTEKEVEHCWSLFKKRKGSKRIQKESKNDGESTESELGNERNEPPFRRSLRKVKKVPRYGEEDKEETLSNSEHKVNENLFKMSLRKTKKQPRCEEKKEDTQDEVTVPNSNRKTNEVPVRMSLRKIRNVPRYEEESEHDEEATLPNLKHKAKEVPVRMSLRNLRKVPRYEEESEEDEEATLQNLEHKTNQIPVRMSLRKFKKTPKYGEEEEIKDEETVAKVDRERNETPVKQTIDEPKEEVESSEVTEASKSGYKRTRECAYCGEKKEQVTKVTQNEECLAKWIEILGRRFEKKVKDQTAKFICLSHFDLADGVRRKHDLPKNMKEWNTKPKTVKKRMKKLLLASPSKNQIQTKDQIHLSNLHYFGYIFDHRTKQMRQIKNEPFFEENNVNSSFYSIMNSNNTSKKKRWPQRWTCRYCGVPREPDEMTTVPKNRKTVYRWAQILGREFFENIKMYRTNSICMRHFEDKRSNRFELPIRDANRHKKDHNNDPVTIEEVDQVEKLTGRILKETNVNYQQTCQLCGEISDESSLKLVRSNSTWRRVLESDGVEFRRDPPMFVCKRHSVYKMRKRMNEEKNMENLFLIDSEEKKPEI